MVPHGLVLLLSNSRCEWSNRVDDVGEGIEIIFDTGFGGINLASLEGVDVDFDGIDVGIAFATNRTTCLVSPDDVTNTTNII